MWVNGKKLSRNIYAHTREECEEKLKVLITEMKAELAGLKAQKAKGRDSSNPAHQYTKKKGQYRMRK